MKTTRIRISAVVCAALLMAVVVAAWSATFGRAMVTAILSRPMQPSRALRSFDRSPLGAKAGSTNWLMIRSIGFRMLRMTAIHRLASLSCLLPMGPCWATTFIRWTRMAWNNRFGFARPDCFTNADEVWYDPGSNSYYFSRSAESGGAAVAVNANNKHVFVPVAGKGIFMVAPKK
jgi:hypothetical protein